MSIIKKYDEYVEKYELNINLLYSAMTGLAILKPTFFDFLNENSNRYSYIDRNFWQSFILELKTNKRLKVSADHIKDLKPISVDKNWLELKRCVKAANIIRNKYFNINRINVTNDDLIIVTDTDRIRFKEQDYKIEQIDIEKLLGFNLSDVYIHKSYDNLIKEFVSLLKQYLKPVFSNVLQVMLDAMFEKGIEINNDTFLNFKLKGLGVKLEELPKLYYNNLYNFSKDVIIHKEAFREYDLVLDIWKEKKKNALYSDIIKSLINDKKNIKKRKRNYKKFISKHFSVSDDSYFTFDKELNINNIVSKEEFKSKKTKILSENIFINENNLLVLHIDTNTNSVKIIFDNEYLSPSKIKIDYEFKK